MAESGVISSLETPTGARWIVLIPSANDAGWREAISQAVQAAGCRLVIEGDHSFEELAADPACVCLVTDAAMTALVPSERVAILMPDPSSCASACAARYDLTAPYDLRHASNLLANATRRGLTRQPLAPAALAGGHPIAVFDDITLSPPLVVARNAGNVETAVDATRDALQMYQDGIPQPGAQAVWDSILFHYDRAIEAAQGGTTFDVTGKPRTLAYGPYFTLPAGRWRATIRFAVDDDAAMRRYRLDWGAGDDYAMMLVHPDASGIYELSIDHRFDGETGAQMRILLMEGAFAGFLTFHGGHVALLSDSETGTLA